MQNFFRDLIKWPMLLYVAFVVIVNMGFSYLPLFHTPIGTFAPMALLVGAVFVVRDYAQRASGHTVLVAMAIGTVLSYALASPYVATASALAFATSELVDWSVYTKLKDRYKFHVRVLFSSLISTPVDSLVFLLGVNAWSIGTFLLMITSKMVVAVWIYLRNEQREAARVAVYGS